MKKIMIKVFLPMCIFILPLLGVSMASRAATIMEEPLRFVIPKGQRAPTPIKIYKPAGEYVFTCRRIQGFKEQLYINVSGTADWQGWFEENGNPITSPLMHPSTEDRAFTMYVLLPMRPSPDDIVVICGVLSK